jgi:hypothetical protein
MGAEGVASDPQRCKFQCLATSSLPTIPPRQMQQANGLLVGASSIGRVFVVAPCSCFAASELAAGNLSALFPIRSRNEIQNLCVLGSVGRAAAAAATHRAAFLSTACTRKALVETRPLRGAALKLLSMPLQPPYLQCVCWLPSHPPPLAVCATCPLGPVQVQASCNWRGLTGILLACEAGRSSTRR